VDREAVMNFEAHIPETLVEALALLGRHAEDARVVGGGTDLYILIKSGMLAPGHLISAGHLEELRQVSEENDEISLGAGLTHSEMARLEILQQIPCLVEAARSVGSPQVRNAGTLGGNLANASPAADLYPPLLALDARLDILKQDSRRTVDIDDFVKGPGLTALAPEEMVGRVFFRRPAGPCFAAHLKVGLRDALAVSVTSAAIVARAGDGRLRDVRIACGAVAPVPIRMRKVEALLEGEAPTEELIREAGARASSECDPITDIRATRRYRCHVTGVVVSRLVRRACRHLFGYGDR
jgi:CO/xanthine dehydrogenase FAD-binding subunit